MGPRHPSRYSPEARWKTSPERAELRALYAEADRLVAGWTCACQAPAAAPAARDAPGPRCCHFGVTGREPYPTAVELEEVRHGMRTSGVAARGPRTLPLLEGRPCPLLSDSGRCRIYASRPFGCRTFFCDGADPGGGAVGPLGDRARLPREALNALGRRIADLSARFAPRDPHPRPLVRALLAGKPPGR